MNRIILFTLLVMSLDTFAQTDLTLDIEFDSTVTISLISGDTTVSRTQLDTGFVIKISDPKAKLLSFSMIYFFDNNGIQGLQQISLNGNKAFIDRKFPKLGLFK